MESRSTTSESSRLGTDASLDILDKLKESLAKGGYKSQSNVNDHLGSERLKLLKILESRQSTAGFQNTFEPKTPKTPGLDKTDYVQYGRKNAINISELIAENTISFEATNPTSSSHSNSLSFHSSEITGRSTVYKPEVKPKGLTVEEILATSCAPNIRSLSQSYRESLSLPRTADIDSSMDSFVVSNPGLSMDKFRQINDSELLCESFRPGEMMNSKLEADERSWAQEYIPIPNAKSPSDSMINDFSANVSKLSKNNFSIGEFFNQRSENLQNIVSNTSPPKHDPVPLVDDPPINYNKISPVIPERDKSVKNTKLGETFRKTFLGGTQPVDLATACEMAKKPKDNCLLSLSTIEREINNIGTDESTQELIKNLKLAQNKKNILNHSTNNQIPTSNEVKKHSLDKVPSKISNKENMDPKYRNIQLSDTISFTESLLNSTELKEMENNNKSFDKEMSPKSSKCKENNNMIISVSKPIDDQPSQPLSKSPSSSTELAAPKLGSNKNLLLNSEQTSRKRTRSATKFSTNLATINQKAAIALRSSHRSPSPASSCTSGSQSPQHLSKTPTEKLKKNPESPYFDSSSDSDRRFQIDSSMPDSGKLSLPCYALVSATSSAGSEGLKTRTNSQCSGCSSEFSSRHGPIPLKASVLQLCWGSVKLRKNVKKSLQIKNTSTKRLILRVELSGPGYQVVNAEDTTLLTLHAQECRTMTISFCPTIIGAAAGMIRFRLADSLTVSDVEIPLYGYGGHVAINVQDIFKGPVGSDFLPMGELRDLQRPLVKTINIYNRGPLNGFAVLLLDSMNLDLPRLCDSFEVTPSKVIILPENVATIKIKFKPNKTQIKKIWQKIHSVLTLANLQIIYGDEPTRQRIRNLIRQMNEKERSHIISPNLNKIWGELPDEEKYLADLHSIQENADVAEELISTFRTYNIALTLNNDNLNETNDSTLIFSEANETILYRTIIVPHTSRPSDETVTEEHLAVSPNRLQIHSLDQARKAFFTIRNKFKTPQDFQIDSNFKHLFQFSEEHGRIAPDNCHVIFVHYYQVSFLPNEEIYIEIKTNNGKIILPVDINETPHSS